MPPLAMPDAADSPPDLGFFMIVIGDLLAGAADGSLAVGRRWLEMDREVHV